MCFFFFFFSLFFFFQAEDGIRDVAVTGVQTCALPICEAINQQVQLQPGMSLSYSGQFEFLERANERLKLVVPATLLIIFVLLYLTFRRVDEAQIGRASCRERV